MSGPSLRQLALAGLAFAVVAVSVYGSVVHNGLAFDALYTVRDNPQLRPGASIAEVFSSPYWTGEDAVGRGLYRPLSILSFQVTRRIWEDPVSVDHAIDLGLHVSCSLALLIFLMQMGARFGAATALALVFLLHPVHSEVVASVVGRTDLLATLFALATLSFALGRRRSDLLGWVGAGVLFSLSLLAKESAVGLLLILPGCWWGREIWAGNDAKGAVRGAMPFAISLGVALSLNLVARELVLGDLLVGESAVHGDASRGFFELRWRALAFMTLYAQKSIWPMPLLPDYLTGVIPTAGLELHARAVGAGVALLASLAWPAWTWIQRREVSRSQLALLLFWIAVAPVCNLVIQIGTPFGERLLYFPSVFLLLAAVDLPIWHPVRSGDWGQRPRFWPVWIVLFVAMAVIVAARTPEWANNRTLFEAAVRDRPENYYSQMAFGATLLREGGGPSERALAIDAFESAARIRTDAFSPWSMLGQLYYAEGDFASARDALEEANRRARDREREPAILNLARSYRALGERERVEDLMVPEAKAHPEWVELQRELGDYWMSEGRIPEAIAQFERVLELRPRDVAIWRALIWARLSLGQREAAIDSIEAAPPGTIDYRFKLQLERDGLAMPD